MAEKELKWYSIFVVLFETLLSIADPITDILTLVEFYRADHKTWFGVGLTVIILPSVFFLCINNIYLLNEDSWSADSECTVSKCTSALVLRYNPLHPAWLKLRTLYYYLQKLLNLRQGNNTDQTDKDLDNLLWFSKFGVLAEAALEAAPQFIIQLYAMAVQQQSVSIIQMVSLPVSFLSIAWASTVADEFIHHDMYKGHLNFSVKDRVLLFVTHLFILSSRLFAVALFTVSYKWWVTIVLIFHCTVITICDRVWLCRAANNFYGLRRAVSFFCLHWLRDDLPFYYYERLNMQLVSNVLFVIENITLILLFYFSNFRHTWYSLPVTICVCLFAVLGTVMRLTYFYFSYKDSDDQSNNTDRQELLELDVNTLEAEAEKEGTVKRG